MNINRDEALRAKNIAEDLMKNTNFTAARKLALKAEKMDPSLENISRMTMVCDVHCAATVLFGNDKDWYGILQVEQRANDIIIKKQYKRLALLLHPDKNKLPGAESAFKLIGEAQRVLLDREKRMLHDIKRTASRKPAPAPTRHAQQVPNYRTQPVHMRNVFNELRPENMHPYQKPQAQPAASSHCTTFWTSCPFCQVKYEHNWVFIHKQMTCQSCSKKYVAFQNSFHSAQQAKSSGHATFSFPQQNKFPAQRACNEQRKHPENPATASSRKASVPMQGSTAKINKGKEKVKGKRKRKNMEDFIESSDSDSSSESEDVVIDDTKAARDLESNGGHQPRRSVRSRRQVSYDENLSDNDVDLVNDNGKGSGETIDTEEKEKKQTHEDHHSSENLSAEEKIKEDQVESSAGASDSEANLSSESEAKPNLIDYADPDFNDFDELRKEDFFQAGQIWAAYDEKEGMPRFYALIKKVIRQDFSLIYVWLEEDKKEENETPDLAVSVGKFILGDEEETDVCSIFSHLIESKAKRKGRKFIVFPRKGETWALFKNWDTNRPLDSNVSREYEYVEILSDHAEGTTISVGFLSKVKGFSCVFCPMAKDGSNICEIPPHEFRRFSHSIPSFRLRGTEGRGVMEGWYELDPAALPVTLCQNLAGGVEDQDHLSPLSGSA